MSDSENTSSPANQAEPLLAAAIGSADLRGAGELIHQAVLAAGELHHVSIQTVQDPRDGTVAPVAVGQRGVLTIEPETFDKYRTLPLWRSGTALHTRLDSFIAHVDRHKAEHSAIFAFDNETAPTLTAIFDYNPEGPDVKSANAGRHRAKYAFPLSDQWKAWTESNGKEMRMADFAAFLEDNIVDVVADANPSSDAAKDFVSKVGGNIASPSKLIEIARGLQVNETSTFREARNLSSGEAEVMFTSQHVDAAGAKLVLPNLFMICIPVFARSTEYFQILARFRYRKGGGSIVFWYDLWRVDLVFEAAFTSACDKVQEQTALPVFFGIPEA